MFLLKSGINDNLDHIKVLWYISAVVLGLLKLIHGELIMHKVCRKVVATVVIIVALALAVVVSFWHQQQQSLAYIIYVSRFFDVMIPVLAVGALIKYLMCGCCNCGCHNDHDSCKK